MHKIRVNGKIINLDAITVRAACREAFLLEPDAKFAEVLDNKKSVMCRITRKEANMKTMEPQTRGDKVIFGDGYQTLTLNCISEAHAMQVARAIASGVVRFTSKAE